MLRDSLDGLYPCLLAISAVSGSLRMDCCWPAFLPFGQFISYPKLLSPPTLEVYEVLAQKIGKEKDESWEDLLVSEKRSTLLGASGASCGYPDNQGESACTSLSPGSNSAQIF